MSMRNSLFSSRLFKRRNSFTTSTVAVPRCWLVVLLLTVLALLPGSCGFSSQAGWISGTRITTHTQHQRPHSSSRTTLYMGMKVTIRIVGRKNGSEKWIEEACSMYETRLRPANIDVDTQWHKNNDALIKGVQGDYTKQGLVVVLLDPLGKVRSSEKLAADFYDWVEEGGSRLVFVIGGAEGLPPVLKTPPPGSKQPILLSLSSLTFTHQFARLVLIEQIYRASEIRKGSGYHK